ncbi:50S ribosomal protein L29 [Succinimonas amylolytica]|uniref:50S ribosomal protein L29 n=1 Tax=Succinimonas amylolytica TaxID=83769 RepID=UPI000363BCA8|nr:50S ribosomal protein L29 [Succinimonas amylolytica]
MLASELKNKSAEELKKQLSELLEQQFKLKYQLRAGTIKDVSLLKKNRHDIARVKQILAAQAAKVGK